MLEDNDENVEAVYIEPLNLATISDQDSADKDKEGLVDDLRGRQLQSAVELVVCNKEQAEEEEKKEIAEAPPHKKFKKKCS